MDKLLQHRLQRLINASPRGLLKGGKKGIEKESLRINLEGKLAQTPHPSTLGSALTHPYITTDYSEALLEFITPPYSEVRETLAFLSLIHQFVYHHLHEEFLWATSMPCAVKDDHSVPIARYGCSNVGKMKHIYRQGLGHRYGRIMQTIAGVHFNYSLPEAFWPVFKEQENDTRPLREFIDDHYFCLVRNFQRLGWLIPYLFGASPAVCKSFLKVRPKGFAKFDRGTYFLPYATSLRMSDIGYKNKNQANLGISYNSLSEYVGGLTRAIETPHPPYEKIGVVVNGKYRQLNTNILQIENEYYSFIRPKQITQSGEKPTLALQRRGVQYVEVRALDVSAYDPLGVNEPQLRFLEALLILCLLKESPPLDADQQGAADHNQQLAACCGRDPHLKLQQNGRARLLRDWAQEICDEMAGICELLDQGEPHQPYTKALEMQLDVLAHEERTPSARILAEMAQRQEPFNDFATRLSKTHAEYFKQLPLKEEQDQYLKELAQQSWQQQHAIEAADNISFQEYLARYFAQH
ncbi:glutamate/cysteine ligase [Nitrosococcus halophilus Nc 4]|uniref:Glutamate--cysteine ligase n=1 Tax=Nitrosococcus halophilus (strain Nc4) TaxID=472759 RepID=D5BZX8_NITHN|nr:glutamate--cysteine ligase [Nitrosococcus halophilus]ADE16225.1 glutamate/cysteine ligase [Nitrosococcus halophilus Nc 4]